MCVSTYSAISRKRIQVSRIKQCSYAVCTLLVNVCERQENFVCWKMSNIYIFFPNLFESTTVCKVDGCFTHTFQWIRRDMKTGFQLTPLQIFKRNVYNGVQRCYNKKLNANTCRIEMLVKHLPCRTR